MKNPPNENVLVVRRELFDRLGSFQELNFEPEKYLKAILLRGKNLLLPRDQAEQNPAYKQIILQARLVLENRTVHYVRGKKAGEQRREAKGSTGIGRRMKEGDESYFDLA